MKKIQIKFSIKNMTMNKLGIINMQKYKYQNKN